MSSNPLKDISYRFALRIIQLYRTIKYSEPILAKQLLRSGTSIGANIEESIGSYSEKEFLSKLMISYKESRESIYWLNLLKDSYIIDQDIAKDLIFEATTICKIIGKTRSTINKKNKQ